MQPNWFARAAYFLLRVVAGLLLLQSGGVILFGWLGGMPAGAPAVHAWDQTWVGGVIEFVCGGLVMLGFFTRVAGFLLSGEMAVAYWQFHYMTTGKGWTWPIENNGMPAVLLCFIFLLIAAAGGGMLSVDESMELRKRKRAGAKPAH